MLQAFFDESVDSKNLVIAGYLASVDKWASFSDEWSELLGMRSPCLPRIDEFHMTEMRSSKERMEIARNFYRVIENHVEVAIAHVIDLRAINEALNATGRWGEALQDFRNPYVAAFQQVISVLAGLSRTGALGTPAAGDIDIVFDQTSNKVKCMEGWDLSIRNSTPSDFSRFGGAPSFKDSKKVMPLQAADLLCYWVREWVSKGIPLEEMVKFPFPWPTTKPQTLFFTHLKGGDYVRHFGTAILVGQIRNAGCGMLTLLDVLNPAQRTPVRPPLR